MKKGSRPDIQGNDYRGLSLVEIARDCLTRAGGHVRGLNNMEAVGRAFTHSTSDFSVILENNIHKILLASFQTAPDTWRRWCSGWQCV